PSPTRWKKRMADLPSDTVTFLFTDIEGSTRLWEENPDAMRRALAQHDNLLRSCIKNHGGQVFKTIGDAFCAVFRGAPEALDAALVAQLSITPLRHCGDSESTCNPPLNVRMALHTGDAELREGDYFGPTLNRVARLLSA